MNRLLIGILVVASILVAAYLYATGLHRGFQTIHIGAKRTEVIDRLGQPDELYSPGFYNSNADELHYHRWPIPTVYVVEVRNGEVVGKQQLDSP